MKTAFVINRAPQIKHRRLDRSFFLIEILNKKSDYLIESLSKFLESNLIVNKKLIKQTPLHFKIGQKWLNKIENG